MKEIILLKEGEIALKGLNRRTFEDAMIKNIRRRLKPFGKFSFERSQSTVVIRPLDDDIDLDAVEDYVSKIFGIAAYCRAAVVKKDLKQYASRPFPISARSFLLQEHSR